MPEVTYAPDDHPVTVVESPSGIEVTGAADSTVGIRKKLSISLHDGSVHLTHQITNDSHEPRTVAPWAITQLPVGGTALFPLRTGTADPHGLQPNAEVVVWPYTGIDDTPFEMSKRNLLISSDRTAATKIGTRLDRGWLAYVHHDLVFAKWARHDPDGTYLDRGASAQCYSSPDFVELETLGPVVTLQPGESTAHEEVWRLYTIAPDTPPGAIPDLLELDGGSNQ